MNRRELIRLALMIGSSALPLSGIAQPGLDWAERKKKVKVRGLNMHAIKVVVAIPSFSFMAIPLLLIFGAM